MVSISDIDAHEDPMRIIYLAHNPMVCALHTIDRDLNNSIWSAAWHLSNVWHTVGKDWVMMDWQSPVRQKEPPTPSEVDWLRTERLHQRILSPHVVGHVGTQWAGALGGNYAWLWQNAMELLFLYRNVNGHVHALTPIVWTLEVMPPSLLETSGELSEPPVTMQAEYHVHTPDGMYVEAIDSWRRYYLKRRQAQLKWTCRAVPEWLERAPDGFRLKKA